MGKGDGGKADKGGEGMNQKLTIYHHIAIFDVLARLVFENRTDTFLLVTRQRKPEGEYWKKIIEKHEAENVPIITIQTISALTGASSSENRKIREALLDLDKYFIDSRKTKPLIKIEPFYGRVVKISLPTYPWRAIGLPRKTEVPEDFFPVPQSLYEIIEIIDSTLDEEAK